MGMTRSQGANFASKGLMGSESDSLALGAVINSTETFETVSDWAERIVFMEPFHPSFIPERNWPKIVVLNVGADVWGSPTHPELQALVGTLIQAWRQTKLAPLLWLEKRGDEVWVDKVEFPSPAATP